MFRNRKKEIAESKTLESKIELTLLDPRAIERDVHTLINIAVKNGYYGVCLNSTEIECAKQYIDELQANLAIISVVGFPLGAHPISTKVNEAKKAIKYGADELDVVINLGKVKEGDFTYIKNELNKIAKCAKDKIVKAIIETCYLTRDEIKLVCKACLKARVDFIKTSTGYGTGGATVEDVLLIRECVQNKCFIKASGGIRTRDQAEELIRAGADRIGTSKVI